MVGISGFIGKRDSSAVSKSSLTRARPPVEGAMSARSAFRTYEIPSVSRKLKVHGKFFIGSGPFHRDPDADAWRSSPRRRCPAVRPLPRGFVTTSFSPSCRFRGLLEDPLRRIVEWKRAVSTEEQPFKIVGGLFVAAVKHVVQGRRPQDLTAGSDGPNVSQFLADLDEFVEELVGALERGRLSRLAP